MDIVIGDLLTIDGEKYITLAIKEYEGNKYAFVNKVTVLEDVTEEFYIFELVGNNVRVVIEEQLKNKLLPLFQQLLTEELKALMQE